MRVIPVTVVAALIERDGKVLICQRKIGQRHELKWEFPGGKVEPGETPPQALERELQEELGIRARSGPELERYRYRYPQGPLLELIFYQVPDFSGEAQNRIFERIQWESYANLAGYDFLEGDVAFVRRLTARG
ncbi:MAG: (deoxy)nucleoside triphosphate pyrophosphohydrolase [Acidobacteria bacterium]|nr:(deoxy)nucleoside triphosphate pyrophosphohydrolase [Acidobacteriota bacterium]